jgi:integrase
VQRDVGGQFEIRPPKYGSERTVYLADGLVTLLAAHVATHCPGADPGRWLFAFGGAVPPHQSTVFRWWHKARTAAGCGAVKLHDLRHFYASGLIAAGCDVVTVQRALGHASATVTLSTYAHLWPTAEDRTRAAAASMLADALSAGAADSARTGGRV